ARDDLRSARPGCLRRGRDRHGSYGHRLRGARRHGTSRRRSPQRNRPRGDHVREDLEAVTPPLVRIGQAGLGNWGQNLVRNVDDLAALTWICDTSDELRERFAARYPGARSTGDFDDLLADDDLEAIV